MNYGKSITARSMTENPINKTRFGSKAYKGVSKAFRFKDDRMSEENEELLKTFPSKDISDIKTLKNFLSSFSSDDRPPEDIVELCLSKDVNPKEILLLDVFVDNDLKTVSRNGISIMRMDGCLEIRNDSTVCFSKEETEMLERFIQGKRSENEGSDDIFGSSPVPTHGDYVGYLGTDPARKFGSETNMTISVDADVEMEQDEADKLQDLLTSKVKYECL